MVAQVFRPLHLSSWRLSGPTLAVAAVHRVNQWTKIFCVCVSAFQIKVKSCCFFVFFSFFPFLKSVSKTDLGYGSQALDVILS